VNLPNTITSARLVLTAVFVTCASIGGTVALIIALVTFVLASFSDWLDGYLARKLNLVTSLGKLLDPLADKILVASAFIYFTAAGLCPAWITCLIIAREFLVTGLRQIAVAQGQVIAADKLGKWKTTLQLTFGVTCLLFLILESTSPNDGLAATLESLCAPAQPLFLSSLYGSLGLTVISGINYLQKSRNLFAD
jgi:CDP-diacylglycerol--glycerol-3-phosphate 3-phosphatidyltransferase